MGAFTSTALGFVLAFVLTGGCIAEQSPLQQPAAPTQERAAARLAQPSDNTRALKLLAQAQEALSQQDYERCANRFSAAAHASSADQTATCFYRAAQCAARAGDYQESGFHIQAAASAGYANLSRLRADPLLRPLQSGPRWMLIDDAVNKNQIDESPQEQELTLCQVEAAPYRQEH